MREIGWWRIKALRFGTIAIERNVKWSSGESWSDSTETIILSLRLWDRSPVEEQLSRPMRPLRLLVRAATKWDDDLYDTLQERFCEVCEDMGKSYAQAWYASQVLRLLWPALCRIWAWLIGSGVVAWIARGCR